MCSHRVSLENIGSNKVTLDIRTNRFEESYSYEPDCYENEFKGIENIMDMFLATKNQRRQRLSPTETPVTSVTPVKSVTPGAPVKSGTPGINRTHETSKVRRALVEPEAPSLGFLYAVLVSLDPTLSLLEDKHIYVNKFRSDLKDKARNFEEKFKRYGYKIDEVINAVDDQSEPLYRYMTLLLEKSIMLEPSMEMYENYGTKQCLVIDTDVCTSRTLSLSEAYALLYENKVETYKSTITLEKLNTLLVKELKEIAESIGCETSKIDEAGKKKNLLKSELRDKIKVKLFS